MSGEQDIIAAMDAAEDAGPPEDRPVSALDRACAFLLCNDIGNKDRLLARYGDRLAFHPSLGWGVWAGTHWDFETGAQAAFRFAELTVRAILTEARAFTPPDRKQLIEEAEGQGLNAKGITDFVKAAENRHAKLVEAHLRFGRASGNTGKIAALLTAAEAHCMRRPEDFDARPFIFNAADRALHLKADGTVEPRPHNRADLLTKLGGCGFDPKATAPHWMAFLKRMQPDPMVRSFLQRLAGYLLTGASSEQAMFVFWGGGRNGKGTFMNALRHVMGRYAITSPIETFGEGGAKDGAGPRPDLVRLRAARFAATFDAPDNFTLSAGVIKQCTGDEPITARDLNKGFVEFVVTAKVIIPCNPKPRIAGVDEGIWRRVNLVPWPITLTEADLKAFAAEHKRPLPELLMEELPGILNWALEGFTAWRREGLSPPEAVRAATADYRQESDPVGEFLSVWADRGAGRRASSKQLFEKFTEFCKANAYPEPKSGISFGKAMKARGFDSVKSEGVKVWLGVSLRDTAREDAKAGAEKDAMLRAQIAEDWALYEAQERAAGRDPGPPPAMLSDPAPRSDGGDGEAENPPRRGFSSGRGGFDDEGWSGDD